MAHYMCGKVSFTVPSGQGDVCLAAHQFELVLSLHLRDVTNLVQVLVPG